MLLCMFFLNKRSNFEKKPHELSYRSNSNFFGFINIKMNFLVRADILQATNNYCSFKYTASIVN